MVMAYTLTASNAPKALQLQLAIHVHIAHTFCRKPGDLIRQHRAAVSTCS